MTPPPQAELIQVVYNGRVSTCCQNSQPVLTITNDGKLEFVTSGQSDVDPQVNRNYQHVTLDDIVS